MTVYVAAQEGKAKEDYSKSLPTSFSVVSLSQFNHCTREFLLDASGTTNLAPDEFVIDKKLNQATLNTTIVVYDFITGMTFPVDINVTWTGVGETFTQKDHFQIKEPGFMVNNRFMDVFREASASGTVTAMGINFTPEPAAFADLEDVKVGDLTISHNP